MQTVPPGRATQRGADDSEEGILRAGGLVAGGGSLVEGVALDNDRSNRETLERTAMKQNRSREQYRLHEHASQRGRDRL